jgi:hypothetical protein
MNNLVVKKKYQTKVNIVLNEVVHTYLCTYAPMFDSAPYSAHIKLDSTPPLKE